ncbi:MAG: hypothetical protein ACHQE6_00415 [Solirubrobacterales bacterium]
MTPLVDAHALADYLGVSRAYVYEHSRELGALKLGNGPRARLRFDLDIARRALQLEPEPEPATVGPTPRPRTTRRRGPQPGSILVPRPRKAKR